MIRKTSDFLSEVIEVRRHWNKYFTPLKGKNCQPIILYPMKIPFRIEGEIKTFTSERKL